MRQTQYAAFIDGLRAIAVLSVLTYHFAPTLLPGGFTGVDIFFAISGFVVSQSMADLGNPSLPAFLSYFYARRLYRIAPALISCLLATTLIFTLLIPAAWLSATNQRTGLDAFFGLSNLVLAHTGNDYFSPRVDFNPFTHTWSLGVEEQFYLVFPWLFAPFLAGRRRLTIALAATAAALSLINARYYGAIHPFQAFYYITTRFWELAAGVLLFTAIGRLDSAWQANPKHAWLADAGAALSLAAIAAGLTLASPNSTPYPGGLLPVAGTLGLIACLHSRTAGPASAALSSPPIRYLGKISYSLYLWHWPVLVLLRWTLGATAPFALAGLAITFALAAASYHVIEIPPRRFLKTTRQPRPLLIAAGLATIAASYGLATLIWASQPVIGLSTLSRHPTQWYPDAPVTSPTCTLTGNKLRIDAGMVYTYTRAPCAAPTTFPHTIYVLGDSHAAAYLTMLKLAALQTGAPIAMYELAGCPFVAISTLPTPACNSFNQAVTASIRPAIHPGDIIFLPSLRTPRIVDQFINYGLPSALSIVQSPTAPQTRAAAIAAATPILQSLAATGAKIVLEGPTPIFASPTFRCADWYDTHNPACAAGPTLPKATEQIFRAPIIAAYKTLQTAIPSLTIWDPFPILCPGPTTCSEYTPTGAPLFFDGDHLSAYANRLLLPHFLHDALRPSP